MSKKILIIDDEPDFIDMITMRLEANDYNVISAPNGMEGLDTAVEENPDLILLDVMMPKVSGYDVCRKLRKHHNLEDLPILFLSAMGQSSDRVVGLEQGANDYLAKPVDHAELLTRVRTHLDLLAAHRANLDTIDGLHGLLPVCAQCKKIRNEDGDWDQLESYIDSHSSARISHGICPDCAEVLYPDLIDTP